jgi:hypothetical protein
MTFLAAITNKNSGKFPGILTKLECGAPGKRKYHRLWHRTEFHSNPDS